MFESTGWIFEEPEMADTIKYDLLVPSTVKPPPNKNRVEVDENVST